MHCLNCIRCMQNSTFETGLISAFFCVLIASSLLCAPGGSRLDQSRTSLLDFSREPVRPVYTLDLLFICWNLHCENFQPLLKRNLFLLRFYRTHANIIIACICFYELRDFEVYWFYRQLVVSELSVWHTTLQRLACIAATIPFLTSVSADNIPFLYILKTKFTMVSNRVFLSYSVVLK